MDFRKIGFPSYRYLVKLSFGIFHSVKLIFGEGDGHPVKTYFRKIDSGNWLGRVKLASNGLKWKILVNRKVVLSSYEILLMIKFSTSTRVWKGSIRVRQYLQKNVILQNIVFFFCKNCQIKNIQSLISYKKGYIDFCRQTPPSPQNGHVHLQMVFHSFFRKYCFSWKTCLIIKDTTPDKKNYINFLRMTSPFPKKWSNAPLEQFFAVSSEKTAFSKHVV